MWLINYYNLSILKNVATYTFNHLIIIIYLNSMFEKCIYLYTCLMVSFLFMAGQNENS